MCHISVGLRANRVKVAMDAQVASPHLMMGWSFGHLFGLVLYLLT